MLRRVTNLSAVHRITSTTRKSQKIVGLEGTYHHYSDSTMSRVIPNKKQADSACVDGSYSRSKVFTQRGLDSYKPTVLSRCDNYLVIDKPHEVRMNGEFAGAYVNMAVNESCSERINTCSKIVL